VPFADAILLSLGKAKNGSGYFLNFLCVFHTQKQQNPRYIKLYAPCPYILEFENVTIMAQGKSLL